MANYSKCPLYPKLCKGTNITPSNYSTAVDSMIKPNISYVQATNNKTTTNSKNAQQLATHAGRNPAISQQNQPNQIVSQLLIITKLNAEDNSPQAIILKTLQSTTQAHTVLTQFNNSQPDTPTRFRYITSNTLDIAVINNFHFLYSISSDHNPVFLNFSLSIPIHSYNSTAVTTCWSEFRSKLLNTAQLSDFKGIRNPSMLESKISLLTTAVCSAHLQASKSLENKHHTFTPKHIQDLIYLKNKAKITYNEPLNPIHRSNYYKKALKKHSQQSWTNRLEALNTKNSLWQSQKFFRKKRSNTPNLSSSSGVTNSDEQKANHLAITVKDNFSENKRPDGDYPIDDKITNTLEHFSLTPPPPTHYLYEP
ncbi:RNA-directed DNA polymerase from mobile element jockey [Trichonephila clavipes]|nr:RNA-directed DNA polymerase from mobile element jockey [Trichonephila clavipes]